MATDRRKKVLITGAAGGMGRACARLFGATCDLILNDVARDGLANFAEDLAADGFTLADVISGDLGDDAVLTSLTRHLGGGDPFVILHTAGLSPSQSDWKTIMRVNLAGSAKLMQAAEPFVVPGTVAILIASTAGHGMPSLPDAEAIMADALSSELTERIAPIVEGMAIHAGPAGPEGIAYSLSKKGVLQLGERKAFEWGALGGRVVTISPGLILTPMGRQEIERTAGAATVLEAAPVGRAGTAMDIAMVARFLASDEAGFISGSDVKVDGGSVSALRLMAATQPTS